MRFLQRLRLTAVGALALLAAGTSPARASLVVAMDLPDLVGRADNIAVVDVISVNAAWDARHERIQSTVELRVVESWKGDAAPASRITIVQPGGTVGEISMVVFGLTQFTAGERSLLFLRGPATGSAVVGMAQGKRPLRRDDLTGRWMADGFNPSGAHYVRPPANSTPATPAQPVTAISNSKIRSLDELREEVRGLIKARR